MQPTSPNLEPQECKVVGYNGIALFTTNRRGYSENSFFQRSPQSMCSEGGLDTRRFLFEL